MAEINYARVYYVGYDPAKVNILHESLNEFRNKKLDVLNRNIVVSGLHEFFKLVIRHWEGINLHFSVGFTCGIHGFAIDGSQMIAAEAYA
jgi:hypothetical protein